MYDVSHVGTIILLSQKIAPLLDVVVVERTRIDVKFRTMVSCSLFRYPGTQATQATLGPATHQYERYAQ